MVRLHLILHDLHCFADFRFVLFMIFVESQTLMKNARPALPPEAPEVFRKPQKFPGSSREVPRKLPGSSFVAPTTLAHILRNRPTIWEFQQKQHFSWTP